jgi:hypothetical protein
MAENLHWWQAQLRTHREMIPSLYPKIQITDMMSCFLYTQLLRTIHFPFLSYVS